MPLEVEGQRDTVVTPDQKHILIVDDYPDAVDIWGLFLGSLGYRVSTASNGVEALDQAQRLLPDLIVLDLELPQLSGVDVARQLRANPETHDIPLIAATGYSHASQLERAREAGIDRVVIKPCDPDRLVNEIERLLNSAVIPGQPSHIGVEHGHNNG